MLTIRLTNTVDVSFECGTSKHSKLAASALRRWKPMRTTLSLTWFAASEMTMQRFERIIRECDYYPYVCSAKYVWPTSNVNELSQLFIEIAIHKQRALVERVNAS